MKNEDGFYTGCPVQYARQFLAGKWQMGMLWNLKDESRSFSELKAQLPGISDKIFMQELNFFVQKKVVERHNAPLGSPKTEYRLTAFGQSLIPLINSIVEWGFLHLQDEHVTKGMNVTPLPAIEAIENSFSSRS